MIPRRQPVTAPMLFTVDGAAEQLSVGRTTVYALIKAGQLRAVRVGRVTRVSADALREYVAGLEQAS